MKRTNGITLIALIITIIVLLILAGVTLNFIRTGNIFGIAGISIEEYRKSQIKENIEVSILDTQLEKRREVTLDEIIDGLIDKGITTEEGSDRENGTVITEEGYIAGIIEKEEGGWEVVIGEKGEIQTSLTYEVIPSQLTSKVTVKIEGKILGEGIKELVLPNGEKKTYESGTKKINEEYEITANGTYTIKLIGNNGTEIEKEININNIVEGIISIVPSTNKPSKKITIEVTYPEGSDSLTKEISIDNGKSWNEYTGEIEITQNTTVQARLKNETEVIKAATLTISNIDTLSPNKFTPSATSTSNSITISGSTEDQEATETSASSGIAEYYFSKDNGETWVSNADKTGTSYTFTGLTQGTNYTLKMKAVDKAGNEIVTEAITKATTSIAGEGSIKITPSTTGWTNKDITITVTWPSDTSGLTKQISTDNGGTWKTYTGAVTISSNCTVKARLIDSTNQTGTSASLTIDKIDKTNPIVTATSGEETIEEGTSKDINSYFTYSANGEAPIDSVIYTDTSDGNKQISNTNTLSAGTHIIKCTVTKATGAVAVATKTIVVESAVPVDSNGLATENVTIKPDINSNLQITIPAGFAPAILATGTTQSGPGEDGSVASIMPADQWHNITAEQINRGIVIVDHAITYDGGNPTGMTPDFNEYVWIPIPNFEENFRQTAWNGVYGGIPFDFKNGIHPIVQSPISEDEKRNKFWDDYTTKEYKNMVVSVQHYKGFYLGRYEASAGTNNTVQSKRNISPWVNVTWATSNEACENNTIVNMHLMYGIEWDTVLNWLIGNAKILSSTTGKVKTMDIGDIQTDSNSWGNFNSSTKQKTGASEYWKANNIYDLAGNVAEWTQEKYSTGSDRSTRGGECQYSGVFYPAVCRFYMGNYPGDFTRVPYQLFCSAGFW